MKIDPAIAQRAGRVLFSHCGFLDDVPAELRNSIANVYYRWQMANSHAGPFHLGTTAEAFKRNATIMARTIGEIQTVGPYIKAVRYARGHDASLFRYMVRMGIDDFTFGIANVTKKSPLRRAIERCFKKSSDLPGLYDCFVDLAG